MDKFSAKLLFQWRPVGQGARKKRRLCEERIVTYSAGSAEEAYDKAQAIGRHEEFEDDQGAVLVRFEFIGLLELIDITSGYDDGEVWYEIREMVSPMERKSRIIPSKSELRALKEKVPTRKHQLPYP